jgi:hypothetical protein
MNYLSVMIGGDGFDGLMTRVVFIFFFLIDFLFYSYPSIFCQLRIRLRNLF